MAKVIVPQEDLDKVERCRKELWGFYQAYKKDLPIDAEVALANITSRLWQVANRKYPEYLGE